MTDLGACWSCVTDLVMPATMSTGFRCVAEAIVRRWQTPRGGLIDDPNYGFDLSDYVNDDLDQKGELARISASLRAEAQKDERVLSCAVTLTMVSGVMMVSAKVQTAQGPFALVVSVTNLTLTLLQVSP